MKNKIKYIGLFLFVCQTIFGQSFLDTAKQSIAFLNKDVILSGLHSNTHLPLIIGFAKRYENTGDSYYRDVVSHFWDMLEHHHCYANGSSSGPRPIATTPTAQTSEHWGKPDCLSTTLTDKTSESCVSHNTQKITSTLFRWTAQPEYADVYMNTLYNSVFALQNPETGWNVYSLPLGSPNKKGFASPSEFFCCNGTDVALTLMVKFDFLGKGNHSFQLIKDGKDDKSFSSEIIKVKKGDTLKIECLPRGGFVGVIR
ncbi:glycoside hydrolase family 127 protein [Flavobacterium sp. LS1R49]|uniref:Glycoside hydrolase family 127 protein n=1 Tax=Flavobacterium shii TaxID=2987687 RepID=A0A9X2ZDN4_9FLAO|nr:glycoside hydrolase family 127 protein [Flavobacterium shii]MCV9929461.1 glycoside hydrolase family 127 protein [Flavobacterium shii]